MYQHMTIVSLYAVSCYVPIAVVFIIATNQYHGVRLEYSNLPVVAFRCEAELTPSTCHAGKHVELTVNRCAIINAGS